jgi:hypothetical protein
MVFYFSITKRFFPEKSENVLNRYEELCKLILGDKNIQKCSTHIYVAEAAGFLLKKIGDGSLAAQLTLLLTHTSYL